ncbi:hypothetical protein [Demequina zhanjiangensis]|uniref:ABC-2 type transport system permease protein n=1 Tax=Demequina zhanjiangensis TaxID=3051659 RepID=A0ABT8FZ36_9MICO|nr:hypothetical protein [Demequina sp. SYSU T00b26]MDN4472077.1 hypothetical protein [Demequina sp. SYSU T00b26]
MAVVLIRLRWAIRRRTISSGFQVRGVWVLAALFGLGAAVLSAALVSFARGDGAAVMGLLYESLLFSILAGWVLIPLSIPSLQDQIVDPSRLETYPMSTTQKVVGLGVGALLSPTALFAFLAALGPVASAGLPVVGRLLTPVLAVLFAAACVLVSRVIQAIFAGAIAGRRGRDLSVLLAGTLGLGFYAVMQALPYLVPADGAAPTVSPVVTSLVGWLPGASVGRAMVEMQGGALIPAIGWVGVSALWVVALAAAWVWAMSRAERGAGRGADRSARRARAGLALPPLVLRGVRSPQVLAAASQHLRYMRRHPRLLQATGMGLALGAFVSHSFVGSDWLATGAAFSAAYMAIMIGGGMFNFDGQGIAYLHVAGSGLKDALAAKQAVVIGFAITLGTVFAVAEAAWRDQWRNLLAALLFVVGMALWTVAASVLMSTRYAFDADRSSANRYSAMGPSFAVLGWVIVGMGVVALLYGLAGMWVPRWVGGLVFVAIAGLLHRLSLRRCESVLERTPELITDKVPAPA